MTKLKTWLDLAPSPDADWPSHQPITLTELVAEARALDWDFTNWCCASGYDASNPEARRVFECLLAYARREGRALASSRGAEVMHRIAVPMIGGMVSSTLLTLIVIPAIYAVVKGAAIRARRMAPSLQQT